MSSEGDEPDGTTTCLRRTMTHPKAYGVTSSNACLTDFLDCDRTVIRQAQNPEEHRSLWTHTGGSFWKGNSLIACALSRSEVRQCRWRASISKRAPSTTRTSLRFRINELRTASTNYRTRPVLRGRLSPTSFRFSEFDSRETRQAEEL